MLEFKNINVYFHSEEFQIDILVLSVNQVHENCFFFKSVIRTKYLV
jgi:hypothetical protein